MYDFHGHEAHLCTHFSKFLISRLDGFTRMARCPVNSNYDNKLFRDCVTKVRGTNSLKSSRSTYDLVVKFVILLGSKERQHSENG